MTCPICHCHYCDHGPADRGQSIDEMLQDMEKDTERWLAESWLARLRQYHVPTYQHSLRVGEYAKKIASQNGEYSPLEIEDIRQMGNLHDLGKLKVRSELLMLSHLETDQYTEIKKHTFEGYKLLEERLPLAACAAGKHHPLYAVADYPGNLSSRGRQVVDKVVPLITLCDFYDALMNRNNDAYAHVDKTDKLQVKKILADQFPLLKSSIDILIEHYG